MMFFLAAIFWISLALVFGVYLGYPLFLAWRARRAPRPHRPGDVAPPVSLIVSAYNEREIIAKKIDNSLLLDYPIDQLEIMVISDCSDDGTDDVVRSYVDRRVVLCRQEARAGKSSGLTRFVPRARGEVLVFSDANSMYDPAALRRLVRHFADPDVGYVVGLQGYADEAGSPVTASEGLYWRYETYMKTLESRIGSVVGGDGAIYAIRAKLFQPLRHDDISDFVNPLQIIAGGHRGVFDPEARCFEHTAGTFEGEFRRKVRIVNRSLRGLFRVPATLDPRRVGAFAYQVWWHKLLRWLVPFFLLAALLSNIGLASAGAGPIYERLLLAQGVCYGLAALRALPGIGETKLVYVPYYFCLVNCAAALGVLSYLAGKKYVTWTPQRGESEITTATPETSAS